MASPPSSLSSPPMSVLTDDHDSTNSGDNNTNDNNNNNNTLNFDNPETLELLLQTITQNLDSPSSSSLPPDWTQMSSSATGGGGGDNGGGGWPTTMDTKENSFASFFPMDLDLRDFDTVSASNMSMSIDPSALHFNTSMFTQSSSSSSLSSSLSPLPEHQAHPYIMTHEDPMSVFALGQPTLSHSLSLFDSLSHSHLQPGTARRLSVTSSSSSSGASLSPILESRESPSSASSDYGDLSLSLSQSQHQQTQQSPMQIEVMDGVVAETVDPAYELAARVRQSAGVTLAVPVSSQVQLLVAAANQHQLVAAANQHQSQQQQQQQQASQSNQQYQQAQTLNGNSPVLAHGQKLAIPRMPVNSRPSPPPSTTSNSPPSSAISPSAISPSLATSPSLASSATNSPSPPPSLSSSSSTTTPSLSSSTTPSAGSPSPVLGESLVLGYPSSTGAPVNASTTATSATSATVASSTSTTTAASGNVTTATAAGNATGAGNAAGTATPGNTSTTPQLIGPSGRPKTSHTTIERRYRTNLNARITGLKHAVPALRVLEGKGGGPNQWGDKVDDRGFVDGVKVARKMSKANVLGKATEYIRVLKNRERRLQHEQSGLKSLISGLVGGPALLREWEREWKERFGGEERDEVEGLDKTTGDDEDDDEGGSDGGDGEDGEEEEGRSRKKARVVKVKKEKEKVKAVVPAPTATATASVVGGQAGSGMPEKRKRGRPRKVPVPAMVAAPPITLQPMEGAIPRSQPVEGGQQPVLAQPQQQGGVQGQPQQYLLAAFAFFSVLNSPLASSFRGSHHSHAHAHAHHNSNAHSHGFEQGHGHHGQVLTPIPPISSTNIASTPTAGRGFEGVVGASGWAGKWGTNEYIQAFHLAVSLLVVLYVVFPWVGSVLRRSFEGLNVGGKVKGGRGTQPTQPARPQTETHRHLLLAALSPTTRGSPSESSHLRAALGVSTGIVGLLQGVIKAKAVRRDRGLEMNVLEQRAWVRLGELIAFDGSVSRATRLQTYWCMSWHVSTFAPSTTDLTTLALIILPVSPSKATSLWSRARSQDILRPYERLALENLNVEDAADWLAKWQSFHDRERKGGRCGACVKRTPLGVLAAILTRERLRRCAAVLFVRSVVPASSHGGVNEYGEREELDEGYAGESDEEREVAREREMDREREAYDPEVEEREDEERKQTIDAGKSIGGRTAELAVMLERIWNEGFGSPSSSSSSSASSAVSASPEEIGIGCVEEHDLARSDEVEIRTLLTATEIYRRIFPSSFPSCTSSSSSSRSSYSAHTVSALSVILSPPSPPPTPPSSFSSTKKTVHSNLALTGTLRAALASGAFDFDLGRVKDEKLGVALEEARDRVCDMLTEVERSVRRNCGRV